VVALRNYADKMLQDSVNPLLGKNGVDINVVPLRKSPIESLQPISPNQLRKNNVSNNSISSRRNNVPRNSNSTERNSAPLRNPSVQNINGRSGRTTPQQKPIQANTTNQKRTYNSSVDPISRLRSFGRR